MRQFIVFSLFLAGLAGCAATAPIPSPYGNFAQSTTANDQKIADDAVKQLVTLYPPANTRFNLQHLTPDAFGSAMIEALRAKGYAVLEFKPETAGQGTPPADVPAPGLPLSYILDQASGSGLYRVTLLVGNQSLGRAYQVKDGTVHAAGHWVRKE